MAYLFKNTPLQTNFIVNLTCLIPTENVEVGRPERLDLHAILWHFLHFRLEVVTKRLEHELEALKKRIHILEGFEKVFDALDEILKIVRKSEGKQDAAQQIIKRFELDAEQTDAILELKIYRLARLEILIIRKELEEKRKRARQIGGLLQERGRAGGRSCARRSNRSRSSTATRAVPRSRATPKKSEYTAEDFIVEEDNVVIVSRDGWVKRQKDVKDISTTRLREGDQVLAVAGRAARGRRSAFFSNFGVAYSARIADVPASTGYGEPIQRFFKLKDGERIVAALSLDPRVVGEIKPKKEGDEPPVHALAVDQRRLQPALQPGAVRRAEHARRPPVRADGGRRPKSSASRRLTGGEIVIAATREARAILTQGRRSQLPLRARPRRHPDQAVVEGRSRARIHRLDRRSGSPDRRDQPRRRTDDLHREVRGHRPRRQGPRAAAARPVHAGRLACPGHAAATQLVIPQADIIDPWTSPHTISPTSSCSSRR